MGKFFSSIHIKCKSREQFAKDFEKYIKSCGYVPCGEDEAAVTHIVAFSEGGWATLPQDEDSSPYKEAEKLAAALKTVSISEVVVDSDFAILDLYDKNGDVSKVIVGDGEGYGVESVPFSADDWKPLIQNGNIEKFRELTEQNSTFVEDDLAEIGGLLGISRFNMTAAYDELEDGDDVLRLYFKKAGEKKLTLNAAFKQVFGEVLEPLGFKLIKSKYPYFVRVVSDEIIHYVTVFNERADGRGDYGVIYKCFNVYCGVATVYNGDIDFNADYVKFHSDFVSNVSEIYTKTHWFDLDMKYRASIMRFYYDPTNNKSLMAMMKKVLAVVETYALPVIGQAVTLEKCMDYFGLMDHNIRPFLGGGGEGLLSTKLFSADEFVEFLDKRCERELKSLHRELSLNPSPKKRAALETRIEYIMGGREEGKKQCYDFFVDPELQEKAPAELERRKQANTELLRSLGLDI